MEFLDAYTGHVGSVHDSRVFSTSDMKERLEGPNRLPPDLHLLGDSAYSATEYMLVPFRDNGHLSALEKKYNRIHSSTRVTVEHSIGLLKNKFRRLKYLDMKNVDEIPVAIFACCVLHNFIIAHDGTDVDDIPSEEDGTDQVLDDNPCEPCSVPSRSAAEKRHNIAMCL